LWRPVQSNSRGDICIAQGLPPESELVRLGNSYVIDWSPPGGGFLPTSPPDSGLSSASLGTLLINAEPKQGKSYIIFFFGGTLEPPAATIVGGLCCHVYGNNIFTKVTGDINGGTTPKSLSGKTSRSYAVATQAGLHPCTSEGLTHQILSLQSSNANNITLSNFREVYGRYILRPGSAFYLTTIANSATVSPAIARHTLMWHEVQLPLGA
jgi:hypothetical protein